jgi:hypothetical protein
MRWLALLFLAVATSVAIAQAPPPPQIEAVPELPAPASAVEADPFAERATRPAPRSSEEIERSFRDGRHVSRVRNPAGAEYMLIEDRGDGTYIGQVPSDSGVRPPLWILFKF